MTFSACAYALKCLVDPDLPVNDGFYRLIRPIFVGAFTCPPTRTG